MVRHRYRVSFKILLSVHKALHGLASKYLCDMLSYKQGNDHCLRSDERRLLHVPTTRQGSFGDRAFMKAGPAFCNFTFLCEIYCF